MRRAAVAAIGEQIELSIAWLNQNQLHPVVALDAAHLGRSLKARTRRRRSWKVQHSLFLSRLIFPFRFSTA